MRSWEVVMTAMEVTDDGEKDVRGMTETHIEKRNEGIGVELGVKRGSHLGRDN